MAVVQLRSVSKSFGAVALPLWILKEVGRPNQASVVNVVATAVILLSPVPVYVSQRLARAQEAGR